MHKTNVAISVSYSATLNNAILDMQWCFQYNTDKAALNCLVELNQKVLVTECNTIHILVHFLQYNLTTYFFLSFVQTQFDLPYPISIIDFEKIYLVLLVFTAIPGI